jgi:hypothetical protein
MIRQSLHRRFTEGLTFMALEWKKAGRWKNGIRLSLGKTTVGNQSAAISRTSPNLQLTKPASIVVDRRNYGSASPLKTGGEPLS